MNKTLLSLAILLLLAAGSLGSPSAYAQTKVKERPIAGWTINIQSEDTSVWFGEIELRVVSFQAFEAPEVHCGGYPPQPAGFAVVVPTDGEYKNMEVAIGVDRELSVGTRLPLGFIPTSSVTHCPYTSTLPCQCNGYLYRDATVLNKKE